MEQLLNFLLKQGLRPLLFDKELTTLEKVATRSELVALVMLKQRGKATMSELATDLGASFSTVTSVAKRLEKRGYIQRERSDRDQRVILITLTEAGTEVVNHIYNHVQQILAYVMEVLSEDEWEQFIRLWLRIVKAIQHSRVMTEKPKPQARSISIED